MTPFLGFITAKTHNMCAHRPRFPCKSCEYYVRPYGAQRVKCLFCQNIFYLIGFFLNLYFTIEKIDIKSHRF